MSKPFFDTKAFYDELYETNTANDLRLSAKNDDHDNSKTLRITDTIKTSKKTISSSYKNGIKFSDSFYQFIGKDKDGSPPALKTTIKPNNDGLLQSTTTFENKQKNRTTIDPLFTVGPTRSILSPGDEGESKVNQNNRDVLQLWDKHVSNISQRLDEKESELNQRERALYDKENSMVLDQSIHDVQHRVESTKLQEELAVTKKTLRSTELQLAHFKSAVQDKVSKEDEALRTTRLTYEMKLKDHNDRARQLADRENNIKTIEETLSRERKRLSEEKDKIEHHRREQLLEEQRWREQKSEYELSLDRANEKVKMEREKLAEKERDVAFQIKENASLNDKLIATSESLRTRSASLDERASHIKHMEESAKRSIDLSKEKVRQMYEDLKRKESQMQVEKEKLRKQERLLDDREHELQLEREEIERMRHRKAKELEERMNEKMLELDNIERKCAEMEATIASRKEHIRTQEATLVDIKGELDKRQRNIEREQQEVDLKKENIRIKMQSLDEKSKAVSAAEEEFDKRQQSEQERLLNLQDEVNQQQQQNVDERQQLEELQAHLEEKQRDMQTQETEIAKHRHTLKTQFGQFKQRREDLKEAEETLENEKKDLREEQEQFKLHYNEWEEAVNAKQQTFATAEKEVQSRQHELDASTQELKRAWNEYHESKDALFEQQERHKKLEIELKQQEEHLQTRHEQLTKLQREKESQWKNKHYDLDNLRNQLEREYVKKNQLLKTKKGQLEEYHDRVQKETSRLNDERLRLQRVEESLQSKYHQSEMDFLKEKNAWDEKRAAMEKEKETLQQSHSKLKETINEQTSQVSMIRHQYMRDMKKRDKKLEQLHHARSLLKEKVEHLKKEAIQQEADTQEEVERVKQRLEAQYQRQLEEVRTRLSQRIRELQRRDKTLDERQSLLDTRESRLDNRETLLRSKFQESERLKSSRRIELTPSTTRELTTRDLDTKPPLSQKPIENAKGQLDIQNDRIALSSSFNIDSPVPNDSLAELLAEESPKNDRQTFDSFYEQMKKDSTYQQ